MKKILSFLGIVLFSHFLYAQSYSLKLVPLWGEEQADYGENFSRLHLTKGNEAYYAILESIDHRSKTNKRKFLLVRYDQKLNITKELDLQKLNPDHIIDFKHILPFGKRLFLLVGFHNSTSSDDGVFAQEFDAENLALIGYPVKITSIPKGGIKNEAEPSFSNPDMLRFQFSPDKTKLLIINQLLDAEGIIKGYDFLLVNEKFDKLGRMDFPISLTSHKQGIYLPQVENSGNFHFLTGPQQEGEKGKMKGIRTPYRLTSYTLATNSTRIKPLELNGESLSKIGLTVGPSGAIFISGFYRDDETDENTSGLFFLSINPTNHGVISQKTIPFHQISTYASRQQAGKKSYKITDLPTENPQFHVKDLLITDDENLILVGETFDYRISMLKANRPLSSRTQVVFGNILAVGLSPLGDLRWTQMVSKNQLVGEKDFELASFSMWQAENNLFLLFNDNKKNIALKSKGKIYPFHSHMKKKEHRLSLVSFDNTGIPQKSQIDIYTNIDKYTKTQLAVFPKESNMIIVDKKKNSIRMVSLLPDYAFPIQTENAALASDTLNKQR